MLNTLYGWYIRKEMGCTFDAIVFTETISAGVTRKVNISAANEGTNVMEKLGTNDFIINRLYTACFPATNPVVCDIMPDGASVNRIFHVACSPREERIEPAISIETGIDIEYANSGPLSANVFIGFDGFWLPINMRNRFDALAIAVVGVEDVDVPMPDTMAQDALMGDGAGTVPYCKRRRF